MNKQIALQRTRMYTALRESHPLYFGDPVRFYGYGGPAWGERNSGGAGLIGAALAVATGGASLGFATLASTLSTISLVSSVVGSITGNKAFSTLGAIAGLGGTFMNLSSAGQFGKDMQTWAVDTNTSIMGSGATQAAAPVQDAIVNNVSTAGVTGANTVSEAMATGGGIDSLGQTNLANADSISQYNALKADSGLINEPTMLAVDGTAAGAPPLSADAATGVPAATNPALDTAATASGEPSLMSRVASPEKTAAAVKAAAGGIDTGENLFDKILQFGKENKELSQVALTGLQGMYTSPEKEALMRSQTSAYDSQANRNNILAGIEQQNAANASAIPTVGGFSVNRNAPIYNKTPVTAAGVRPAGFIQTRA
jgi:hypothetical protein